MTKVACWLRTAVSVGSQWVGWVPLHSLLRTGTDPVSTCVSLDFRLAPRCKWDLRSSGMLLNVDW